MFGQVNIGSVDIIGKIIRLKKLLIIIQTFQACRRICEQKQNRSGTGPAIPTPGIISFIPAL
jgi:hypothetical protein